MHLAGRGKLKKAKINKIVNKKEILISSLLQLDMWATYKREIIRSEKENKDALKRHYKRSKIKYEQEFPDLKEDEYRYGRCYFLLFSCRLLGLSLRNIARGKTFLSPSLKTAQPPLKVGWMCKFSS